MDDTSFAARVIAWQRQAGRHDLPWQNTTDAYRIWLSEIMLQQTQVAAVLGYYQRFLTRFPDLATLAAAPLDDVMQCWSGLGYYSRARNLHACAQRIMRDFGGNFPRDPADIASLPGIGRSTAAAIAAFAFGARAAILDGNVKRVLCRVFGVDGFPGQREVEKRLWTLAEDLLPAGLDAGAGGVVDGGIEMRIEMYTQGLMDLGATLCKPRQPDCPNCPVQTLCVAHRDGRTAELPVAKPRAAIPERSVAMIVLLHGDDILLEKRPPSGIWGGLWSFPEVTVEDAEPGAERLALRHGALSGIDYGTPFTHTFTHFRLHVQPVLVRLASRGHRVADVDAARMWMDLSEARDAALPTPVKKLVRELADERDEVRDEVRADPSANPRKPRQRRLL